MKGAGVAGHHSIPTILVVDDEPMIRMAVTDHLKDCCFLVIEATGDMGEIYAAEELCVAYFFLKPYAPGDVARKVHGLPRL